MYLAGDEGIPNVIRLLAYLKTNKGIRRALVMPCSKRQFELLANDYNMVVQLLRDSKTTGNFILAGMGLKIPGIIPEDLDPAAKAIMMYKVPDFSGIIIFRKLDGSEAKLVSKQTSEARKAIYDEKEKERELSY